MSVLQEIAENMQKGRARQVTTLVEQARGEGIEAKTILNEALLSAMMEIGRKFKNNEIFVPEVLVAARAMTAGIKVLEPDLAKEGNEPVGRVVLGTVQDDLHDIGKNLVALMMRGAGFEVVDLKVSNTPEQFVQAAEDAGADIIAMSALLTTTMPHMKETIELLKQKGIRDKYIVMVGGAPVNQAFADEIGADLYAPDAATAAETAKEAVLARKARG